MQKKTLRFYLEASQIYKNLLKKLWNLAWLVNWRILYFNKASFPFFRKSPTSFRSGSLLKKWAQSILLYCMLFQCYNYNDPNTAKRTKTLIKSANKSFFCLFRCYIFLQPVFPHTNDKRKNEMRCQTISISRPNWSFSAQTGL